MTPGELKTALDKCVKCGRCLGSCPIYKLTGWEGSVARGKLALLKADLDGDVDLGGRMKDLLSHCLLCGACAAGCASGVKGDELIQAGRALALGNGGLAKLQSLATRDLLARGPAARTLWKTRRLFLKNVPPESGLHFRFPVPGLDSRRWLPALAEKSFLEDLPRLKQSRTGPRVGLFFGCTANFIRPQSARAAVRLLESVGARVVIPKSQVCCGKPAAGAGDQAGALYLARRNVKAFAAEDLDFIIAFCATCSAQLREYEQLPGAAAEGFSGRVMDISRFLAMQSWRPDKPGPPEARALKVFYHDPCHLRRKQGIFQEPRSLLRLLPGVELVGADEPPVCCGYGGVFNLWHYDLSLDLFQIRHRTMAAYSPDLAVTSCSGCWLQLQDGLKKTERPLDVLPLVELLAQRGLGPDPAD
ncbi:MAG: (Fe-S)-binding protein [Pseudomonadota bacterium]